MSSAVHTRRLAELRCEHSASFGGKSSTLGELIAAEIPVPPGFAVSTTAFHAFIDGAGLQGMIASETARMSLDDVDSVGATSHAIGEAMCSAPMPDEWAIARGRELPGSLFVVQSRPVTALPQRDPPPRHDSAMALVMSMFGAGEAER